MKFGPDIWQSGRTQINKGEERGIGGRRGKGERGRGGVEETSSASTLQTFLILKGPSSPHWEAGRGAWQQQCQERAAPSQAAAHLMETWVPLKWQVKPKRPATTANINHYSENCGLFLQQFQRSMSFISHQFFSHTSFLLFGLWRSPSSWLLLRLISASLAWHNKPGYQKRKKHSRLHYSSQQRAETNNYSPNSVQSLWRGKIIAKEASLFWSKPSDAFLATGFQPPGVD